MNINQIPILSESRYCLLEELSGKLVYLASAYSHPNKTVEDARANEVAHAGAILFNNGIMAISPIALESRYRGQTQLETNWIKCIVLDRKLLIKCDAMVMLSMEGLYDSKGVLAEVLMAVDLGIPLYYFSKEGGLMSVSADKALNDFMENAHG